MRKIALILPCLAAACAVRPPACVPAGRWISPVTLAQVADPIPRAAPVVLLGETHDSRADHLWQLDILSRLYARNPRLAVGFEMFPRAVQPVLDAWSEGRLSESDFLKQTDWQRYWGFDAALYLPIFRFARDHRLPMIALNVSHHLVHLAAQSGWANVPASAREGVGNPAPPSPAYRASLADAMAGHGGPAMTAASLQHFIDAQLVWDRAMAEAIAAQRARDPARQMVAIMGAGHLEDRGGVPHQLAALGVSPVTVLLPGHNFCSPMGADFADAVFTD